MYVGLRPDWMTSANAVYRAGVTIATDPTSQREPFLRRQLEILGREPHVGPSYGPGDVSTSQQAVRMYRQIRAARQADGSLGLDRRQADQVAAEVQRTGQAARVQFLGARGEILDEQVVIPSQRDLDRGVRQRAASRAVGGSDFPTASPNRKRAVGYGWKSR